MSHHIRKCFLPHGDASFWQRGGYEQQQYWAGVEAVMGDLRGHPDGEGGGPLQPPWQYRHIFHLLTPQK